jgi:uncharacterized Zn-finger protein
MHKKEIFSDNMTVKCGGFDSESNHPNVYLKMSGPTPQSTICPYCDIKYILRAEHNV